MNDEIKTRLVWIQMLESTQNAGIVCRRCGISRPTLRKWAQRYSAEGIEGLKAMSRRPISNPHRKINENELKIIKDLRIKRNLGIRRIKSELLRYYEIDVSTTIIHRSLIRNGLFKRRKPRRFRKHRKRYSRPIPGDRVQMDVCKIAPGLYQYTAIDDCTRFKILGLYPRISAKNSIHFLDKIIEEFPFPIQRIQTDRGKEFFAYAFQERLLEYSIKFRPIKPRSPFLNGKVERSQKTDLEEFYATANLNSPKLKYRLEEWQFYYNWQRPHSSLGNKSPIDRVCELLKKTPFWDEVTEKYDPSKEFIRDQNYELDMRILALKR